MGKADIYLIIGRSVITIYLIIVFIMVLAESVERSNITSTEPSNYKETVQVMQYVVTNFQSTPLTNLGILDSNLSNTTNAREPSVLSQWSVSSDWCSCLNKNTFVADLYPHLGSCTTSETSSTVENCTTHEEESISLTIWRGTTIAVTTGQGVSFPTDTSNTCNSVFQTYQSSAGLCTRTNSPLMTSIMVTNWTTVETLAGWTFAGEFASYGNSTPPITYTYNTTSNSTNGSNVYFSQSVEGSPYLNIKVQPYSIPCLDPTNSPSPSNEHSWYPLTGNSTGCGYWNTSEDLYEVLDRDNLWDFYLNNDLAENKSTFSEFYGFTNSTIEEIAVLYAEKKLIVNSTDFCLAFAQNPDVDSNIEDIPNLTALRESLCILGFVVSGLAFVVFLGYLIATRGFKNVSKETVGIYVFWFQHGLGCLYSITCLILGDLTYALIDTIDSDNANLNDVADAACISNVPLLNDVYAYLADGISDLYSYIESYNEAGVIIAIIFLVLETILLVWWLIGFSCHENLEEEDAENKRLQGAGPRS